MRNVSAICLALLICLGAASGASAQNQPGVVSRVSVPPTPLSFSEVAGSSGKRLTGKLIATVVANHPYRLGVSFRGLNLTKTNTPVPANQMTVKINNKPVPIGPNYVEVATGPMTLVKGVSVPLTIEIELKDPLAFPAGQYSGVLSLAVR
jgi:hypothetical protein